MKDIYTYIDVINILESWSRMQMYQIKGKYNVYQITIMQIFLNKNWDPNYILLYIISLSIIYILLFKQNNNKTS